MASAMYRSAGRVGAVDINSGAVDAGSTIAIGSQDWLFFLSSHLV
jgi:hypothetical protein